MRVPDIGKEIERAEASAAALRERAEILEKRVSELRFKLANTAKERALSPGEKPGD